MTQQMLILFVLFVERSQVQAGEVTIFVTQSQQAMAVFSWFLFMVYGAFGTMLYVFRNDLVAGTTKKPFISLNFICCCFDMCMNTARLCLLLSLMML